MTEQKTHRAHVRARLLANEKISPLSALRDFGCLRLADVIYRLRGDGWIIETDIRRQGRKRYAVYRLAKGEEALPARVRHLRAVAPK